jgi:alkylated DNA nucleotide flippase Atl1
MAQRPRIEDDTPDTTTLRVQRVLHLMEQGRWLSTRQVARVTGMSESGALKMLNRMASSEHVPVTSVAAGPGRILLWGLLAQPDSLRESDATGDCVG